MDNRPPINPFVVEQYGLTETQVTNLMALSAYLRAHDGQIRFDMGIYNDTCSPDEMNHTCGAVACAVGYGPVAGIPALPDEGWAEYRRRCFLKNNLIASEWMFGVGWANTDNTPLGAARRIDRFLAKGVPMTFLIYPYHCCVLPEEIEEMYAI